MTIRAGITTSHDRVWEQLAAPGAQLTGPERQRAQYDRSASGLCPTRTRHRTLGPITLSAAG